MVIVIIALITNAEPNQPTSVSQLHRDGILWGRRIHVSKNVGNGDNFRLNNDFRCDKSVIEPLVGLFNA